MWHARVIPEIKLPPCSTVILQQICEINLHQLPKLSMRDTLNDSGIIGFGSKILKDLKFSQISPSEAEYVADGLKRFTCLSLLMASQNY